VSFFVFFVAPRQLISHGHIQLNIQKVDVQGQREEDHSQLQHCVLLGLAWKE
jgi:hypothetical protein